MVVNDRFYCILFLYFVGAACNPASRVSFPFALRTVGMEAAEIINVFCDESMMKQSSAPISSLSIVLFLTCLFVHSYFKS